MLAADSRDRLIMLAYGIVILLAPVLILVITLGFLVLSGDLVLGRLTPLEFLELYLIDLAIFVVFGYGIYRITLWAAKHRLPALLNTLEAKEAEEIQNENTPSDDEPNK